MFVVKVPGINSFGKTKGCENSGNEILNELKNIPMNEQGKIIDVSLLDLEEIHLDNSNLELTNNLIYKNSLEMFETKPKTIFLGGDHSISYSLIKAFYEYARNSEKEPCLIVFDSHPNCVQSKDVKFPTNEEWLRHLIEKGFPTENIFLVGVRNLNLKENKFLKENNIKIISMNQLLENLQETCEIIMEFSNKKELYVSIDMSFVDPLFAPSTSHKEVGGLTSRQFIYLIKRMNKIKTLRAVDIVEINEGEDKKHGNMTLKLGAKILSELI
tara:strand:- start:373 stop:1185 length:813 start_codon:yes stop_codon:yes gene_type:complete